MVNRSGDEISIVTGVRIYLSALLTRYVPGGIWPFAQVSLAARRMKSSPALYTYLFSVNLVFTVLAATALGLPVVLLLWEGHVRWAALLAILLVGALLITGPYLLRALLGVLGRVSDRHTPLLDTESLPRLPVARLLLSFLGSQVLAGLALAAFVGSQIELTVQDVLYLVSCWCASWLSGFLVFPVPMGLGVREAVLTSLLSSLTPGSVAVVIAITYRLLTTLIDLLVMVVIGGSHALYPRKS